MSDRSETKPPADEGRLDRRVRRSPWFDAANQPPARCGWYEVRSIGWPGARRGYWSGDQWHAWKPAHKGDGVYFLGLYRGDRWRGLLAPNVGGNRLAPTQEQR